MQFSRASCNITSRHLNPDEESRSRMKWVLRIALGVVLLIGSLAMAFRGDWVTLGVIWLGFAFYLASRKHIRKPPPR